MEQNKMCHSKMKFTCIKQATFEAQFLKKLSNNEVELKKSVAYKKTCSSKDFLAHFDHVFDQNEHNDLKLLYFNRTSLSHLELYRPLASQASN